MAGGSRRERLTNGCVCVCVWWGGGGGGGGAVSYPLYIYY